MKHMLPRSQAADHLLGPGTSAVGTAVYPAAFHV